MPNDLNKFTAIPESKFVEVRAKNIDANVDGLVRFNIREFDAQRFDIDRMVVVNEAFTAQGKDVSEAYKGLRNGPIAE